jgi:hypothetical protein
LPFVPALPLSFAVLTKVRILFRPIAGHANLCPSSISTKPQELDILLSTVKHEMLHALGFSVSLFAFYRQGDRQLSAASISVVQPEPELFASAKPKP